MVMYISRIYASLEGVLRSRVCLRNDHKKPHGAALSSRLGAFPPQQHQHNSDLRQLDINIYFHCI